MVQEHLENADLSQSESDRDNSQDVTGTFLSKGISDQFHT